MKTGVGKGGGGGGPLSLCVEREKTRSSCKGISIVHLNSFHFFSIILYLYDIQGLELVRSPSIRAPRS